jgi:hypothetical protein
MPMVTKAVMVFPFHKTSELMKTKFRLAKSSSFPSWHSVAENRKPHGARLARDEEVPFIRYVSL